MAQWIRHRPTEPGIAGSSPAGVILLKSNRDYIFTGISCLSPCLRFRVWVREQMRGKLLLNLSQAFWGGSEPVSVDAMRAGGGGSRFISNSSSCAGRGGRPTKKMTSEIFECSCFCISPPCQHPCQRPSSPPVLPTGRKVKTLPLRLPSLRLVFGIAVRTLPI